MAQSILIFDFGPNEEAAQQARHKVEAWTRGARLGKKILLKFEREQDAPAQESVVSSKSEPEFEGEADAPASTAERKGKKAKKSAAKKPADGPESESAGAKDADASRRIRLLLRLDFSDHEKLTRQRWLDRIAAEEPFKSAKSEAHRSGEPAFAKSAELFDSLD
jgi:hypothetical protein